MARLRNMTISITILLNLHIGPFKVDLTIFKSKVMWFMPSSGDTYSLIFSTLAEVFVPSSSKAWIISDLSTISPESARKM